MDLGPAGLPRRPGGGYASSSSMARFVTKGARVTPRLGTHTIVLIAVVGVTLASAFTRTAPEMVVATVAAASPDTGQALPAQRTLELETRTAAAPELSVTQGADQR